MSNMTFAEYRAAAGLNWSSLKHMDVSPLMFKHRLDNPGPDTPAMLLGRAAHTAILEPDRFPREYVVFEGKARRGKEWESFAGTNQDKDILKATEYDDCLRMKEAVRSHPVAGPLLEGIEAEKSITWRDRGTDVLCKARIDAVQNGAMGRTLIDLKTTNDPVLWFGQTAARFQYHGQLAWYWEGLAACGQPVRDTKIIAVQSSAPWDVVVYDVPGQVIDAGWSLCTRLLDRFVQCTKADHWPGAGHDGEIELMLPGWAMDESEADDLGITIGGA